MIFPRCENNMKRFLLLIVLVLAGCSESEENTVKPVAAIDSRVVGTWQARTSVGHTFPITILADGTGTYNNIPVNVKTDADTIVFEVPDPKTRSMFYPYKLLNVTTTSLELSNEQETYILNRI